jgi:hypothetical protein
MKPKNTICLWLDKEAHEAARFYAATFPDSAVTAVHGVPSDYPSGKQGDVLTVEFTVLGIPCLGLNGGPAFKHSEALRLSIDSQEEGIRRSRRLPMSGPSRIPLTCRRTGNGCEALGGISLCGRPRTNIRPGRTHQRRSIPGSIPVARAAKCCLQRRRKLRRRRIHRPASYFLRRTPNE